VLPHNINRGSTFIFPQMKPLILPILLWAIVSNCFTGSVCGQSPSDSSEIKSLPLLQEPLIITTDTSEEKPAEGHRSHFETGLSYQSNDVYLGRKDSAILPYYIPQFSYYHKSGFFVTTSLNYLKNATDSRIDLVSLAGGYMFHKADYEGQLTLSKYFYSTQSTSVKSQISASLEYDNSYDFGFIEPFVTGTLNFGTKTDIVGLFGLEHSFYLASGKMDITPTIAVSGSTQNYYSDYYKKARFNVKKQKLQTGITSITGTVQDASTFKILDYEPTIPINYRFGKCTINFSPTYSIPVQPAVVAIQTQLSNGTVLNRTKTEKLENTFYWSMGFSILF
jgi:hypothetical protein